MRDGILHTELEALQAIARGEAPTKAPSLSSNIGPDIRRRYGPFRPTSVGNPADGGFLHPKIEGAE